MKIPALAAAFAAVLASLPAADEATKDLLAPGFAETAARMTPNTPGLKVAAGRNPERIEITIPPGAEGYPGVNLAPNGGAVWDHSCPKQGNFEELNGKPRPGENGGDENFTSTRGGFPPCVTLPVVSASC